MVRDAVTGTTMRPARLGPHHEQGHERQREVAGQDLPLLVDQEDLLAPVSRSTPRSAFRVRTMLESCVERALRTPRPSW